MFVVVQSVCRALHGRTRFAALAVVIATTGCAIGTAVESGQLSGACQMRPCECVSTKAIFGVTTDIQPVQWQDNGNAFCPEGYRLRLISR